MCGIYGLYRRRCYPIRILGEKLVKGLHLLEYRGYDSAGVAIETSKGDIMICKAKGNVKDLSTKLRPYLEDDSACGSHLGIAHTRWATHGPPCDINSHPHTSYNDAFVVVHNGIITNYKQLRSRLEVDGYAFKSETDTEVIPLLCYWVHERYPMKTFPEIIRTVISFLEGTYALLILSKRFPGELCAYKSGSPLIIAKTDDDDFAYASDINALVDCKYIYVMGEGELVHTHRQADTDINNGSVECKAYDVNNQLQQMEWQLNTVAVDDVTIGDYSSFMKKEIYEQPTSVQRTISCGHGSGINFAGGRAIVLIACGTSYHSCVASQCILAEMLDTNVYIEVAGRFSETRPKVDPMALYIFVSQSGETAETIEALRYVRKVSPVTVCIGMTNNVNSTIARESRYHRYLNAGLEISVASTKAYTSQLAAFLMIANVDVSRVSEIIKNTLITTDKAVREVAKQLLRYHSVLFVGRGNDYATALEAALKVKEIGYVHSEGILASELKHGPLAMIDDDVGLVVFATQNRYYQKMVSVIEQLKARRGNIFVVCTEGDTTISSMVGYEKVIQVPTNGEYTQHLVNIIPMQLLAHDVAMLKGNKIDQPRNLAKSVTVSD